MSHVVDFPLDSSLGSFRSGLSSPELTVNTVHTITRELEELALKKPSSFMTSESQNIFFDMGCVDEEMVKKDLFLMSEIDLLTQQVHRLMIEWDFLAPQDILNQLGEFQGAFHHLCEIRPYNEALIKKALDELQKKINHLEFRMAFPIIEELSSESYQNNFSRRMEALSKAFREGKKWEELSEEDKQAIFFSKEERFDRKSCQEGAEFIEKFVGHLKELSSLAQELFYGDWEKGKNNFDRLAEKGEMEKYIWRMTGKLLEEIDTEEKRLVVTTALMAYVQDQIIQ